MLAVTNGAMLLICGLAFRVGQRRFRGWRRSHLLLVACGRSFRDSAGVLQIAQEIHELCGVQIGEGRHSALSLMNDGFDLLVGQAFVDPNQRRESWGGAASVCSVAYTALTAVGGLTG